MQRELYGDAGVYMQPVLGWKFGSGCRDTRDIFPCGTGVRLEYGVDSSGEPHFRRRGPCGEGPASPITQNHRCCLANCDTGKDARDDRLCDPAATYSRLALDIEHAATVCDRAYHNRDDHSLV